MAKIIIAGDVAVLESAVKLSDLKRIERYNDALCIRNEDGDPVFGVTTDADMAHINKFGISFTSASRNGSGAACITLPIPESVTDVPQYLCDIYGKAIKNLEVIEARAIDVLEEINTFEAGILSRIEVR